MIGRLYTHTINVYRKTSTILDGVTTVFLHDVDTNYEQPAVLQLEIESGDAQFTVTGLVNGLTTTSTVVFSPGGTIYKKQTDKAFNTVLSIQGTTGTAETFTARTMNKTGQPLLTEQLVFDTVYCRMDTAGRNVSVNDPRMVPAAVLRPDEFYCFVSGEEIYEGSIKVDDIIVEGWTLDETGLGTVSTRRYTVKNVNTYYGRSNYRYMELILGKIDT